MKKEIPGWDVRAFSSEIEAHHLTVTGHVTHIARSGWKVESEQYVVDAQVRGRSFKFTILHDEDHGYVIHLLSTIDGNGRVTGIHTFQLENERLEFLFEEALIKLCTYKEDEQ